MPKQNCKNPDCYQCKYWIKYIGTQSMITICLNKNQQFEPKN